MARLGEALRAERERMGLTLEQAAEDTRIREKFLRALENGDYQTLPGAVYTKGFLRNYAEYLDLDPDALILQFQTERGAPDAPRSFEPMRPIMRRSVILTPAVLVPVVVLAAVALFLAYLYYQFTTFAVLPRLEISEPAGDAIVQVGEYTIRGQTVPEGRLTIRVDPGPEIITGIRAAADGTFSVRVPLKPGANHVEVRVRDATEKQNDATRTIRYEAAAASPSPPAAAIALELPPNGATYTNAPVPVAGRAPAGSSVTANGRALTVSADGRFAESISVPAGAQTIRVVVRPAAGAEVVESRSVTVAFTAAVVTVRIDGPESWLQAVVDDAVVPGTGRIYARGQAATFSGRQVTLRVGDAGATFVIFNGQELGFLGAPGQVVERSFTP
ncbi:MAG TPA: helix-turn-helix domain-containing protein [Candidatus Limnocylindria bacterium]|nr:helix-turn-helix domain-containing protein [Candidatus Limnocylindria bacterium]